MVMEILVEVPQEILDGIARGEYIRKGGVVVTKEGHKVIAWLKETIATGSNVPPINPVVAGVVVVAAAGFIMLNNKLNHIIELEENIGHTVKEVKDIVEDIRNYQYTSLFADYRSAVTYAERGIRENRNGLLENARNLFIQVGERVIGFLDNIIRKDNIVPSYELYTQLSLLYYACSQCDVHSSMAMREYETAKKATEIHRDLLYRLKTQFCQKLSSATANVIEQLDYAQIDMIAEKPKMFDTYLSYMESNIPVIEYLEDYEVPYLEFSNFMADFENNSYATVCLPKISVHHN